MKILAVVLAAAISIGVARGVSGAAIDRRIDGLEDRIAELEHPDPIRGIVGADDVHVTTTPPVRFQP